MNGEMNGAIEEPMETSPSSPTATEKKLSPKNTDESGDQCESPKTTAETSNHMEEDKDIESKDLNEIRNKLDSLKECKKESSPETNIDELESGPSTSENQKKCENENNETDPLKQTKDDCKDEPKKDNSEKLKDGRSKSNDPKSNTGNEESDEVDSEQDSSDEDGSVISNNPRADTVSINSESEMDVDETSQESHLKEKNEVILDKGARATSYNGSSCDAGSPEIHEITSDNDDECVVTNPVKTNAVRFSNRKIKRKKFDKDFVNGDEDESDVEEVEVEDPLKRKTKPIIISNAKTLVDIAKQSKLTHGNQKKGTTVVIIDSPTKGSPAPMKGSAQNTGSTSRNTPSGIAISKATGNQHSQPSILPSLTDDMFVVEAPSFIVPYVYEKPSLKPFREYVDVLGRELEEQKAKEEKERLIKETEEREIRQKEKKEKLARGEEVDDSEDEKVKNDTEEEAKKKKAEKKARRQHKKEDDDVSWDGESSSESEDEILSDEESKTVVLKDKADSIGEIKDMTGLTIEKISTGKSDNYFDCSLGKFFVNIGLNLVQEFVQTDLLKQQNRKLYKEKKAGHSTKSTQSSIMSLIKNIEFSKENNAPYSFTQKKCEFCSFKSESSIVLSNHLETPHMKNNVYKCNFCSYEIKSPHEILLHMDTVHKVRGKLERAPAYHQCANCPFEDNGKGKLARHLIPCAKKFKPDLNLAPPVEWEPPAKIPKIARSRNSLTGPYGHGQFGRGGQSGQASRPSLTLGAPGSQFRARGRSPLAAPAVRPQITGVPIIRGGVGIRQSNPAPTHTNSKLAVLSNGKALGKGHQPSISITPLPRQPPPVVHPLPGSQGKSTFVICEICDGYIKDLEQLRNHMQWIHRVKIHPKMIYNRPPLNCQKCQFRFFTDQGLERHLLGSHGLVTSSMQEAANKGKDAGRCPVCGRVYQWKLLAHVARDHNLTLKPAHLSYKCTVCTATFGMYKQFESHVYSAHSVVAKRVMDKGKAAPSTNKASNDSLLKPVKINDEITIIPQPVKTASTSTKSK